MANNLFNPFNPYAPMPQPRRRPYMPMDEQPPNYYNDVQGPQDRAQVTDYGNKLMAALQPRPVSTGRRILAGVAGAFGGPELAQGITGRTAQNREVEQLGGQFNIASKIADANRQKMLDQSLLGQRGLEARNIESQIYSREHPRPVAPPTPVAGRDVPLPPDVVAQRLALQPKPAAPQQIPGRDVPLSPEVERQRIRMAGAEAGARANAKPDRPQISPRDVATVRTKLLNIKLAKQQLADVKNKFAAAKGIASGPFGQSLIPSEAGKAFDKSIDRMRQTFTSIMRVPGVGSMSDFETRLQQAQFPKRGDYESVTADNITQLESMLANLEQGYSEMAGAGPAESEEVEVISPDGTRGTIPRANLQKAIQRGYKQAQ